MHGPVKAVPNATTMLGRVPPDPLMPRVAADPTSILAAFGLVR
jgi:hypothetical protein